MSEATRRGTLRNGYWIKHPSASPNSPYTYTSEQVRAYLVEIGLIGPTQSAEDVKAKVKPTYHNLEKIVRGHLRRFPFENTEIHYSPTHELDVTPQGAFQRLVGEKKGGSYCFGMNGVMYGILRGLGYRVYSGTARVNHNSPLPPTGRIGSDGGQTHQRPVYTPLSHMVLFVQPFVDYTRDGEATSEGQGNNQTYMIDVGFGSPGLARPILLADDGEDDDQGVMGVGRTERHRLKRGTAGGENIISSLSTSRDGLTSTGSVLNQAEPDMGDWVLQVWHAKASDLAESGVPAQHQNRGWKTLYTFTEAEYFLQDYLNSSLAICHTKVGIFWEHVFVCKHAAEDDSDDSELIRTILFSTELRRTVRGKSELIRKVESEKERLEVLQDVFGIVYDVEEALGCVKGRVVELGREVST
ncbi:cysteine proteinase [Pluteus cervinus]|uniref:Cysteine proteinase n=1 Tax=Pluteus cervinus TaxID=181527 RepID=A0ACD3ALQ4_9AGAR|nr:cysteine proteinase [Pluteus cervinus]